MLGHLCEYSTFFSQAMLSPDSEEHFLSALIALEALHKTA